MTSNNKNKNSKLRPQPVKRLKRSGGNPTTPTNSEVGDQSYAPVSSTFHRGTLFQRQYKSGSVTCMALKGGVVVLICVQEDKYFYHLSMDNFRLFMRFDNDSLQRFGRGISLKRFITLCKKYGIDANNANVAV